LKQVDARLLAEILEHMLAGEEPNGPLLNSWHIGEAVDHLEASGALDRNRLVRLEFGLIPALGYKDEQRAKSFYDALMSEPKLFVELLCILYGPATADEKEPPTEAMRGVAKIVWRIFYNCTRQPGTQPDGTIDCNAFVKFIDEARELCRKADRLGVCDETLGQILAHAPADCNGAWPFGPAREVLDRPELENLRRGFQIGIMNKRGVTSRACDEGGDQERKLADIYRNHARAMHNSHPNLAAALEEVARWYEHDALREELRDRVRREGH
jgi:hypothetical protein